MSLGLIPAIISQTRRILTKILRLDTDYTTARAVKLDNLDATISSRLSDSNASTRVQTGLTDQGYTSTRAGYLDQIQQTTFRDNVSNGINNQGYSSARATKLDNLNATVSSRLADSDAVARTQTGLTNQGYTSSRASKLDVLAGVIGSHQLNLFGDGRDGSPTITVTTPLSAIRQYINLTINSGGNLIPSGGHTVVVLVNGTLTINSGGTINADGFGRGGGGSAKKGTNGFMSKDGNLGFIPSIGATGLSGDNGLPGRGDLLQFIPLSVVDDTLLFVKGAGGGGGPNNGVGQIGGDGGDIWSGGGKGGQNQFTSGVNGVTGGTGGGTVIIFANNLVINGGGRISARGLPPSSANFNAGAGGGGGGLVYLIYRTLSVAGTLDTNGGSGGGSTGQPGQGGAGSAGIVVKRFLPS